MWSLALITTLLSFLWIKNTSSLAEECQDRCMYLLYCIYLEVLKGHQIAKYDISNLFLHFWQNMLIKQCLLDS